MVNYKLWDANLLNEIRSYQNANLTDTCTIKRPTTVANGRGGVTRTFTIVASNVPCRVFIASGPNGTSSENHFFGDREVNITDSFLILPWNQDIRVEDYVDYTAPTDQNTESAVRTYKVVGMNKPDSITTVTRARVESVRG
jgi:hypothetical protein